MISGKTKLIGHLGYPTESFKAPLIYNPYFEREGIDAVVVPMGSRSEDYPDFLRLFFRLSNALGALVTMHDLNLASQYADRVVMMSGGRVASCGAPGRVLAPEPVARCFDVGLVDAVFDAGGTRALATTPSRG